MINSRNLTDGVKHPVPSEADIDDALLAYYPLVFFKLLIVILIPFVLTKLQQKKKKTLEPMDPPPVPKYDETYCVFAIKIINTMQAFLIFIDV